jgi:addiction module RelE/StbE family toxin
MSEKLFEVLWTQTAQQDLQRLIKYIEVDSSTNARNIYFALKQKAEKLSRMPLQGRIVPEFRYYNIIIYRELIYSPWRMIYKVEGSKVWILAVIDGRRNVEDVLLDRFF